MSETNDYDVKQSYDLVLKILLVGDMGVGKSCLLTSFTENQFKEQHPSTIGLDFRVRSIKVRGKHIKLQIWDTAGQECFKPITTHYFRGSEGALMVYDITKKESFDHLNQWFQDLERKCEKDLPKVLIGNKNDLAVARAVQKLEGREYAENLGIPFLETSARKKEDVEKAFLTLTNEILAKPSKTSARDRDSIILRQGTKPVHEPEKSDCCKG